MWISKISVALIAFCLPLAAGAADPLKSTPPQQKALSSPDANQRYVFGQISENRKDQFLLDTKTGRLWRYGCANGGQDSCIGVLQPVLHLNIDNQVTLTPQ